MALLKLFVDVSRKSFVLSDVNASDFQLPRLVQGDTYSVEITFVEPAPSLGIGRVTKVDCGSYSMRVGIGVTPIASTSVSPVVLQTVWTWDSAALKFTGTLALNTADLNTAMGAVSSKDLTFEIELKVVASGFYETMFQGPVTILAELIEDVALVPVAGDSALGRAEANATFVKKRGLPGETFSMVNAEATWEIIFRVDENGTLRTETMPYVP